MFRRYAFIRQHDHTDCGAAALAMIAQHHGHPIGVAQVRALAGTDQSGTSLLGLVQGAEKLGFSARGFSAPYEALATMQLPAIVHLQTEGGLGHFAVLYAAHRRRAVVADPARGIVKIPRNQFIRLWTGRVVILTPDATSRPASANPRRAPGLRFWRLPLEHAPLLAEAVGAALLMTLLGITISYFVKHLVDSVLVRAESRILNAMGLGMLLVVSFRMLFNQFYQYILLHVGRRIDLTLISSYVRHLLGLPLAFFETRRIGEVLARVNDAARVREAISGAAVTALVDGLVVVVSAVVLLLYDRRLALVAMSFVPILVIKALVYHPFVRRRSREAMEQSAQLSAHLIEDVAGMATVKAFGLQQARLQEGESRLVRFTQAAFLLQRLAIGMSGFATWLTGIAGIAVLWYGGHRVMAGALTIGELMFFYTLLSYMLGPLERLAAINMKIQDALVALDRLYSILDLDLESPPAPPRAKAHRVAEAIELRNVSFQYGCRKPVIADVSLRIPAGSTVALVGESGSGKSTLLKLLMQFYQPAAGQILIDGIDLRDYDTDSVRDLIGLVAQDPFVFNATVRENIAVGCPTATFQEIVQAAEAAGLHEFISSLPDRYQTMIGEMGANLSGGQRQRLAIARALIRQPDILLFDEATSHLDSATERTIQHNLRTAFRGKTVILVAHRLSTVQESDVICLMHEGRLKEQGTHEQLLGVNGRYAALWRAQTGVAHTCGCLPTIGQHLCLSREGAFHE